MSRRGKNKERIIRVLLNEPEGTLSKYRVAKLVNGSFSWVHEYLRQLEARDLIDKTKVKDYEGLVNTWVNIRKKPDKKEYLIKNPLSLLRNIQFRYALTTYQAETLVQNYLFPSRTDVYIKRNDKPFWHKTLSKEGLVGKGNFRLLIDDDHVFYGSFNKKGLKIVSLPQLIVDLYNEGGVCAEAADKLLEKMVNINVHPE